MGCAVLAVCAAACSVGSVDLAGKRCPCIEGYVCDMARDVCVPVTLVVDGSVPDSRVPVDAPGLMDVPQPASDAEIDGGAELDASGDGSTPTGCSPWTGAFTLEAPMLVSELSSTAAEDDIFLSPDGLTVYFSSNRAGGVGGDDNWTATRRDTSSAFSMPVVTPGIDTTAGEGRLSVTPDGLEAFFASNRAGGMGSMDIWHATRRSEGAPFGSVESVASLSSVRGDFDPVLTATGLALYFAPDSPPGGAGLQDIVVARRASLGEPFATAPMIVAGINTAATEADATANADETVLVFQATRAGGVGLLDLWYVTRASSGEPWSSAALVPVVNSATNDTAAFLSADGCELWFSSDRPGGVGGVDLYHTRRM